VIEQTDVSDPPAPPTGPVADVPTREANRYASYLEWRETIRGADAWAWLRNRARSLLLTGEQRISTKGLVEDCRAALKVEINNTYTAWLADDLVRWDPRLLNLIERRRRRKDYHHE
jgi:hypothetical protein